MIGIIVYQVNVGSLPPFKAEAFIERLKCKFKEGDKDKKLSDWGQIFIPVREQESKISVFCTDENKVKEIEPLVFEAQRTIENKDVKTKEELRDYAKVLLGAPVIPFKKSALEAIDYFVDKAFTYDVGNKKQFIADELDENVVCTRDLVYSPYFSDTQEKDLDVRKPPSFDLDRKTAETLLKADECCYSASMPGPPAEIMNAIREFYPDLGDKYRHLYRPKKV